MNAVSKVSHIWDITMDIMMKVAFFADVTGLATAVAGLCEGFEGPSAVNVHWNARRECALIRHKHPIHV
jgi:hypothetical protein